MHYLIHNLVFPSFMSVYRQWIFLVTGLLWVLLLTAGCDTAPPLEAPAPVVETPVPEVEAVEPEVEPTPVHPTALVRQNANVRAGPGLDHGIDFWLTAGTEITVRGRNVDATWLWIEQAERAGWIFATLTNLGHDTAVNLPEVAAPEPEPQVAAVPTPTPEPKPVPVVEPTPMPEPEPEADEPAFAGFTLMVTGNPVNVRQGPSTDFPVAFQAAAGDRFEVTGRNADATWLQIADPRTAEGRLWIYRPLTDFDAAFALAEVPALEITLPAAPAAEAPAHTPAPEPAPEPAAAPGLPHNPLFIDTSQGLACAVKADSTVACWGSNREGQLEVPPGNYRKVEAGDNFACGHRTDGTIACWGAAPAPLGGTFRDLSVGTDNICGLRADGNIECRDNSKNRHGGSTPPAGPFKAFSIGHKHGCAIRLDDTLTCWGYNYNNGTFSPPSGTFKTVSGGSTYACGLRTNGTLACWGQSGAVSDAPTAGTFAQLNAGDFQACALRPDGTAVCWGDNAEGQSSPPAGTYRAISSGFYNSCGVRSDGAMLCWGAKW